MKRVTVAIVVGVLCASSAGAVGSDDRQAAFFGAGGTWAKNNFSGTLAEEYDDSWGFQLRGGYRFLPFLSAECVIQYVDRYAADVVLPNDSFSSDVWTLDTTLGAKAGMALGRFYPYAEIGVGVMVANDFRRYIIDTEVLKLNRRDVSFVSRYALGSDLALLDWLGAYAEVAYVLPAGSNFDRQSLQLTGGLRLVFARPE